MCFTVQLSKIIFRIAVCLKQLCYYIMLFSACQEVFSTFLKLFLFLSRNNFDMLSHPTGCCQELFSFLFHNFFCQTQLVYIITSLFRCQELFSSLFHPTQKEGFEPSHGANRLYPQQGHLFSHLSTSARHQSLGEQNKLY